MPDRAVGLLGPTVVFVDGDTVDPGGQRIRRVLAALAARSGQRVRTEQLIDDVWGDGAPSRARASLQMHISKLRRLLEPTSARIETVDGGYRLRAPPPAVDVVAFGRAVDEARAARTDGRWETAEERSARALGLWRSDDLAEVDDIPSLAAEATHLRDLRRQARTIHAEALLALGDDGVAVDELDRAVRDEPFVERFWELLMLALYRSGRQADALAAYRRAAGILGEELGIEPGPALQRLEEQILLHDEALLRRPVARPARWTLPDVGASLVGRDGEVAWMVDRLAEGSPVVVVGPGGVGKTRVALEAARRVAEGFADGGAFVDLTVCDRDRDVAAAVAEQLRVDPDDDPESAVCELLVARSMVLVVDNCEHVPAGASKILSAVAAHCPDVALVATSRCRLDVPGEVLTLESLPVPPPGTPPDRVGEFAAVALFCARARAVAPAFDPDDDELGMVADLCRRLDGLPLAVELVAAWMNVATVGDVVARIVDTSHVRSRVAVPDDRHAGLAEAFDWSFRLLGADDRDAFVRLSVFRSFFGLDGAAAVLGVGADEALGVVRRLADASLLTADLTHRHGRYRMLETIRGFAASRLDRRDDRDEVLGRYRRFVFEAALRLADGCDEAAWFDTLQAMLPDLRAVMGWAEVAEPQMVVDLAERLRPFWTQRGLGAEIEPRLEAVLEGSPRPEAWYTLGVMRYARGSIDGAKAAFSAGLESAEPGPVRARLLNALGVVSLDAGDYQSADALYREAEALFAAAGHDQGVAAAVLNRGIVAVNTGRFDDAEARFEAARVRFRDLGDRREEAHALLRLAFVAELAGRPEIARERARAALRIVEPLGVSLALADALQYTAEFELGAGSVFQARTLLVSAVEAFRALGNVVGLQRSFLTAAAVAAADEQWTEAAEMSAYAAALRAELGIPVPAANRDAVAGIAEAVAAAVPRARRDALAERARLADVDGMVERCLDVLGSR